jgi:hypothetical protein
MMKTEPQVLRPRLLAVVATSAQIAVLGFLLFSSRECLGSTTALLPALAFAGAIWVWTRLPVQIALKRGVILLALAPVPLGAAWLLNLECGARGEQIVQAVIITMGVYVWRRWNLTESQEDSS